MKKCDRHWIIIIFGKAFYLNLILKKSLFLLRNFRSMLAFLATIGLGQSFMALTGFTVRRLSNKFLGVFSIMPEIHLKIVLEKSHAQERPGNFSDTSDFTN